MRALLRPLAIPYGALTRFRAWSYRKGIARAKRLPGVVISVGNLTVGGTGKTPFVIWLTSELIARGNHVAILTRGYRGKFRGVLSGAGELSIAKHAETMAGLSDETCVAYSRLSSQPNASTHFAMGVGPDRFAAGQELARGGFDWFVLDDGFQHLQLARDLNILLIDATNPFGEGHLLPAGHLREPHSAMRRADIILITRGVRAPAIEGVIRRYLSKAPIFYATMRLDSRELNAVETGAAASPHKFFAFAAIGNPSAFFENLREWGVSLAGHAAFPDHHKFSRADAKRLMTQACDAGADSLVCTQKDSFNLRDAGSFDLPLFVCNASLEVHDAEGFWRSARAILKVRRPEIVT
ncbi:MAG TPA: tetraacyldisaccharide 4'-kinase [Candidatus Acidoferrales bacterium]|nr:tetraacyldisaccharide 4'-kinase [Candidatus Acidoferrales bacterium]